MGGKWSLQTWLDPTISHIMDQVPNEKMLELLGCGQDRGDGKLGSFPTHTRNGEERKDRGGLQAPQQR
jgi:hypothetical protein